MYSGGWMTGGSKRYRSASGGAWRWTVGKGPDRIRRVSNAQAPSIVLPAGELKRAQKIVHRDGQGHTHVRYRINLVTAKGRRIKVHYPSRAGKGAKTQAQLDGLERGRQIRFMNMYRQGYNLKPSTIAKYGLVRGVKAEDMDEAIDAFVPPQPPPPPAPPFDFKEEKRGQEMGIARENAITRAIKGRLFPSRRGVKTGRIAYEPQEGRSLKAALSAAKRKRALRAARERLQGSLTSDDL